MLLLVACSSTTFVYNRLDFLLSWYVDDYADLNRQQEAYFAARLVPFLDWHRHQELPRYLVILDGIGQRLDQPLTTAGVAAVFEQFEAAWLRIETRGLDLLLDLGVRLSDAQVAAFMDALWKQQRELEKKYLERSDADFYEDSYDELADRARDYLGALTGAQRALLHVSSRRLLRSDRAWIKERADWLTELGELLRRQPLWQQDIRDAVARRREHPPEPTAAIYAANMGVIFEAVAQLLNERTARQDRHLRARLQELRADLQTLSAEGAPPAAAQQPAVPDP